MSWSDITSSPMLSTIIFVLAGFLGWLARHSAGSWIDTKIEHKHAKALQIHKNEINQKFALYETSQQSYTEGQKASVEKKLDAIDQLWAKILVIRNNAPPLIFLIDILDEGEIDEYRKIKNHPDVQKIWGDFSIAALKRKMENISDSKGEPIENIRPYVGEYLWSIFFSYKSIYLRLHLMLQLRTDAEHLKWNRDEVMAEIIEVILTSSERDKFAQMTIGRFSWLQRKLESKMLSEMQRIISGKQFGSETFEQGRLILQKVVAAEVAEKQAKVRGGKNANP